MAHCKNCGAPVDEQDIFCANCGAHIASGAPTTHRTIGDYQANGPVSIEKEPMDKLFCELAWFGLLFWLPLAAKTKHPYARFCAKEGLSALLFGTVACITNQIMQWGISAVLGWLPFANSLGSLVFMIFLFFMLYLTYRCVKGALAVHNDEEPEGLFPVMQEGGDR